MPELTRLYAGPEASGIQNWLDGPRNRMQAFQAPNGEYLVTNFSQADRARTLFFRWQGNWTVESMSPAARFVASAANVTIEDGKVASWSDLSGHGLHVSNVVSYGRPTFNATGWNASKHLGSR